MRQGEIWEMYFDPTSGREQSGKRPAVIVSGNVVNENLELVIVCPLTTSIKRYEGDVLLKPNGINGLKKESEVLIFHIRSVDKNRLKRKLGKVDKAELEAIRSGIHDILKY